MKGVLRNVLPRNFIRKPHAWGKAHHIRTWVPKTIHWKYFKKLEIDYPCLEVLKQSEKEAIFNSFEEEGKLEVN